MTVEVCAENLPSIESAAKAGADRIELCSELEVGGITPSYGFIQAAVAAGKLPIHVLIRPRSGHFCYTNAELKIIEKDIMTARDLGCQGVVVGALQQDFTLPHTLLEHWVKLAQPLEITFHRAFDVVVEPKKALLDLIALGFDRILTSGQADNAVKGLPVLQKLLKDSRGQITIMPGGGIRPENCKVFKNAGFEAIHFSASRALPKLAIPSNVPKGISFLAQKVSASDCDTIQRIVNAVKD